jgi:tripartite-type tricarboxylate transporter receptor subunit TctC
MPELPAIAETLPGYTAEATIGFFVPRQTPPAVITFLNREIVQSLKATDPQRLMNAGIEIVGSSPEEFAGFIKAEMDRMGKVMKSASFSS